MKTGVTATASAEDAAKPVCDVADDGGVDDRFALRGLAALAKRLAEPRLVAADPLAGGRVDRRHDDAGRRHERRGRRPADRLDHDVGPDRERDVRAGEPDGPRVV